MLFSIKLFQYYEQFVVRNELTFDELAFVVVISLGKSCVDKKLLSDSFSDIIKVNILLRLVL